MKAYYNENDPFAANWLRNLIEAGLIAAGDVDERSITDVKPSDLDGYTQHHFFAGIGGWSYALRLAGWPDDRPVVTGSCPCQPFSSAGKGRGVDDERHLWPAFRWLLAQRPDSTVFGEQVASRAGRTWLAGVRRDMEAMGNVFGSASLSAGGYGFLHIRERLFWGSHPNGVRLQGLGARQIKRGERTHEQFEGLLQSQTRMALPAGKRNRLADGLQRCLAGFGNAIVPEVAAEFIAAYMSLKKSPAPA